jgi:nicotinate-nucleotide--dimethylbenzimidazole phosphoribosyltransferase
VAAIAMLRTEPQWAGACVFSHLSVEQGHAHVLNSLGAKPLLQLDLRLGEGTGALLAYPLVKAAAAMLCEMASFSQAGVSEALSSSVSEQNSHVA